MNHTEVMTSFQRSSNTSPPLGTCTNYQFRKFQTARSRLYQSRFLQPNTHFAGFFEIYKIHKPLHRSKIKNFRIFAILFWKNSVNSRDFLQIFLKSAEISSFSLRISRKFVGIPRNPRKLTEIRKLLRNFAKFCENPIRFCQFRKEI